MPLGPFNNFDACVVAMKGKGHTEEEAGAICGKMQADAEMGELSGHWIEVFKAGNYGEKGVWTPEQLDQIASSYDPRLHAAPVVVGHPADDAPAWGWVQSLRRAGQSLWAKLEKVQPALEQAIKDGRFTQRSVALYKELPQTKTPYLRHLGFLGAAIPHVKGLEPIHFQSGDAEHIEFAVNLEEKGMDEKNKKEEVPTLTKEAVGFIEKLRAFFTGGAEKPAAPEAGKPVADFAEEKAKLEAGLKAANDEIAALKKGATDFAEGQRAAGVRAWWDAQLAKGQLLPAFEETYGLRSALEKLSGVQATVEFAEKDAEGKPIKVQRPLGEVFQRFLGDLGKFVEFGELTARARRQATRKGKVVHFAEPARGQTIERVEMAERMEALKGDVRKEHPAWTETQVAGEAYDRAQREHEAAGQQA